jgi:outer membrane protein OmpU
MKKILLATTLLAASAGFASAEIALSGSARMGVINTTAGDLQFSSRVRIQFDATGTTDGGLSFGASMRADQIGGNGPKDTTSGEDSYGSGGTTNGDSTVFISGAFGKLTMGDVAGGAADNLVGQVSGVGYTGLGDNNEIGFTGGAATAARYDYTTGNLSVSVGLGQPVPDSSDGAKSIAVKYATDMYNVALGYSTAAGDSQIDLKAGATFGAITGTLRVAMPDTDGADETEYAVSLDYAVNPALKLTAFYTDHKNADVQSMGLGASYDLGGGASVVGGVVDTGVDGAETVFDMGVTMSF